MLLYYLVAQSLRIAYERFQGPDLRQWIASSAHLLYYCQNCQPHQPRIKVHLLPPGQPNMHPELQSIEMAINASAWLAYNAPEPLIGGFDCPHLAERWGLRGISVYAVFVEARPDNTYGCRQNRCRSYIARSLERAIQHQRYYHFNHSPFVCIPSNGTLWFVSSSMLSSSVHRASS